MAREGSGERALLESDLEETAIEPGSGGDSRREIGPGVAPGDHVGRYLVLERAGSGGMGVVYSAFDPELDRRVALKLLKSAGGGAEESLGRSRLLREAQAMAKLTHPNVVSVFDVGTHEGSVFVAMEFVHGQTLGDWLAKSPRQTTKNAWREVLELLIPAGQGLAAAHAAGLVHRDFKPHNVLIGDDGRVLVLDFGLATASGRVVEPPPATLTESSTSTMDERLTQTGLVMGTPAYMAPEQHRGKKTDARSDQFNYAVTLYEALYGERPFAGTAAAQVRKEVFAGRIRDAPADSRVPAWLRRIVLRALSVNPAKRWPDMAAMLDALGYDRAARRRRAAVGVLVTTLAGLAALGYVRGGEPDDVCGGAEERLAGIWDEDVSARIAEAFAASDRVFAEAAWKNARPLVDAYARDWTEMYAEACRATHDRGEQSAELLDRRMQCLDARRDDLAALTTLYASADERVVERSIAAVYALPPLAACADVDSLLAGLAPPEDPQLREAVASVRNRLAGVRTELAAGRYPEALALAEPLFEDAVALEYAPLEAEAALSFGRAKARNGDALGARRTLLDAVVAAEAAGHLEVAASAWTELVSVASVLPTAEADAHEWARHAEALIERRGDRGPLRAQLLANLGGVEALHGRYDEAARLHQQALELAEERLDREDPRLSEWLKGLGDDYAGQGRYEESLTLYRRALLLAEATGGPDHPDTATALNGLAIVYDSLGRPDESRPHYERAIDIFERSLGPKHPSLAAVLNNLAGLEYAERGYEKALVNFERALDIWTEAYGPEHADVALTLGNMGLALEGLGRFDEAREHYERSLELRERAYGVSHPDVAVSLENLGDLEAYLEHHDEALALHERGLTIRESSLGKDHPYVANSLERLGMVRAAMGAHERALAHFERAREVRLAALGSEHWEMASLLTQMASAHLALGRPHRARPQVEEALKIHAANDADLVDRAEARFVLARLLWDDPASRPRARQLAEQAREGYAHGGMLMADDLDEVAQWLASRRGTG